MGEDLGNKEHHQILIPATTLAVGGTCVSMSLPNLECGKTRRALNIPNGFNSTLIMTECLILIEERHLI